MRKFLSTALATTLAFLLAGQTALEAQAVHWPDSAGLYIRATDAIAKQIGAGGSFSPACNHYLPAAVGRFGIAGGILSTFDRTNRSGRIGMAAQNDSFRSPDDGLLHECFEAYSLNWGKKSAPATKSITVKSATPGGSSAGRDWQFIHYLLEAGLDRDACEILFQDGVYAPSDTIDYLRGLAAYHSQDFGTAAYHLGLVDKSSPLSDRAFFRSTASLMELGCNSQAESMLESYSGECIELKRLQMEALGQLNLIQTGSNSKKPWVAAAASAVIPGLGKVYAGNLSEGIASFLVVGSMGAVTAECILKKGCGDWRTITFGTIGALFYLGNIYGSYFSVERINTYNNEAQTQAIMYNIHLPLRSLR